MARAATTVLCAASAAARMDFSASFTTGTQFRELKGAKSTWLKPKDSKTDIGETTYSFSLAETRYSSSQDNRQRERETESDREIERERERERERDWQRQRKREREREREREGERLSETEKERE